LNFFKGLELADSVFEASEDASTGVKRRSSPMDVLAFFVSRLERLLFSLPLPLRDLSGTALLGNESASYMAESN
jgi:hypothetical protein